MFRLENKTAVITGGASGIGKAISILFAMQGAAVHIIDQDAASGSQVAGDIRGSGGSAIHHAADITKQPVVQTVFNDIGKIDILVNNAGAAHIGNLEKTTPDEFKRIFEINVAGVYNCLQAAVPRMAASGGGAIVNMSSIAAHVGLPDRFAYSMSKGAVAAMTLSVAKDYISYGIRCNSISPARVHTPFVDGFIASNYAGKEAETFSRLAGSQPIGRMADPGEIAALALFLCADEAAFITGSDYPIDGGFIKLNN